MATRNLGIVMNGVTGRMGLNQHLVRSIVAIREQGGVALPNGDRVMPDPILVGRNAEKVAALDAGADDYVEKPFALGEFLARLRAALRRASERPEDQAARLRIGPLEIDFAGRLARLDGGAEPLRLTPREWDLLAALARSRGRVVTQRQLLSTVWGPAHADDTQYLRVYVGHLRQKLGSSATLLRTEPGVGYRFGGP